MKTILKYSNYIGIVLVLCAIVLSGCSCSTLTTDPLAGWQKDYASDPSDQIIERDYKDYIQKLPIKQKGYIGGTTFYKNEAGQHAVSIQIFEGNQNASWEHLLIYDKNNKRIKTIRYNHVVYIS